MGYGVSYGQQGDPFLGGLVKGLVGGVKGAIGGVIRSVTGAPDPRIFQGPLIQQRGVMPGGMPQIGVRKTPGVRGLLQRLVPGGATGFQPTVEGFRPRRKRMNPANPKALRRAIRRQDGFVKLARRALKGSGYTIVSRGSRRPRRDLGAGHTHVR